MQLIEGCELAWTELCNPATPCSRSTGSRARVDNASSTRRNPRWRRASRLIVPDRPGYGASAWQPRHTFKSWASDVTELADHLGLEHFAVLGIFRRRAPCGGLHSLPPRPCHYRRARQRCRASRQARFEAGMMPANKVFARLGRTVPAANAVIFGLIFLIGRRFPAFMLGQLVASMPPVDRDALARLEVRNFPGHDRPSVPDRGQGRGTRLPALRARLGLPARGHHRAGTGVAEGRRCQRPVGPR